MTFVGRLFSGVLLGMTLVARVLLASAVLFWADSVLSLSLGLPCCHNAPRQFLAAARVAPGRRSLADARLGLAYSRRRQLLQWVSLSFLLRGASYALLRVAW